MNQQYLSDELIDAFDPNHLFDQVDALDGEIYRKVARRRTLRTVIGDKAYFAKIHFGVGWGEILKNLLQGRLPVLGAGNEYRAIKRLGEVGVPTMEVALYCESGANPAQRRSAILTGALDNTESLEHFQPASPTFKRRLIREIGLIAKGMHEAGINHRDFYLCHFLMDNDRGDPLLRIIDLHRAQLRARVPERWLVKDLGGLLFSAFNQTLTHRDLLRFVRVYTGRPLRELTHDLPFWRKVIRRAKKLYLQDHDAVPDHVEALLARWD